MRKLPVTFGYSLQIVIAAAPVLSLSKEPVLSLSKEQLRRGSQWRPVLKRCLSEMAAQRSAFKASLMSSWVPDSGLFWAISATTLRT